MVFANSPVLSRRKQAVALSAALLLSTTAFAASDPGVRGGVPGAGGPIAGLTAAETTFFNFLRTCSKK